MKILAIEQSTSFSSAAIMEDSHLLAERNWEEPRTRLRADEARFRLRRKATAGQAGEAKAREHQLFSVLANLFSELSLEPGDIDAFAADLGPGSFSGLRIALSAASAFALPDKKPVTGVSSGEALALDLATTEHSVSVVGDARRGFFWIARFSINGDRIETIYPYALHHPDELPGLIPDTDIVVSPEWERTGPKLEEVLHGNTNITKEKRVPSACSVARIALRNLAENPNPEPPSIIYLHPPTSAGWRTTA